MAEEVAVAKVDEIPPGSGKVVEAAGKTLAVFNLDGNFYVIDNTCLHRGGPLGEGLLEGKVVTCPWHGWEYDVTTGQNTFNPSMKVETYKVTVKDGEIRVQL
jgi:NAD(P)H-dependent nitrite reductase small subunit